VIFLFFFNAIFYDDKLMLW